MTTDEQPKRGGRREGAGRKPTLKPLKAVRLHEPVVRDALAAVTAHEREVLEEPLWSQEEMIAELILAAYDQLLNTQVEYTDNQTALPVRTRDSTDTQPQTAQTAQTSIEYTDNQTPAPIRAAAPEVYQLRIVLVDIEPEIWRRVLVRSDATLEDLHDIIQICFGWEDYHLHQFGIGGGEYGDGTADESMPLTRLGLRAGSSFGYVYDFGDHWVHEVEVEAVLPFSTSKRYPQCVAGARPAPEEDSGGAWAYMEKQRRSERAKAAARKRKQARGTSATAKKKRKPTGPVYDRAHINRRLTAWAAGDDFYMAA
ncbi:MAG: plasmid pRiA4b ORF-3 family protein [Herpetosiphonaceae bacterium]|nr:plasmid pRiA4b ORF-3 family protein [Herpetosiphonaceae bacterium]